MRLERRGALAIVALSGLLSLPPLLGVPRGIEATFRRSELIDVSFAASTVYGGTSFPSDPRFVLPTRVIVFLLIVFCIFLSLALAVAISWSDRARRTHWPLAAFLTALPVAISWEYVLVPLGTGGGPLAEPYLAFVRIGVALLFGTAAVMLPRFAAGFPDDLSTTHQPLIDEATRRSRRLQVSVKSPHFAWLPLPDEDVAKQITIYRCLTAALSRWWLLPTAAIPLALLRLGSEFVFGMSLFTLILVSLISTTALLGAQSLGPQGDRIHWIAGGATGGLLAWGVIGTLPFALGPLLGDLGWDLYLAGLMGIAPFAMLALLIGGLGLAVLYQGAIDPRLAIRRTTVYGALGVLFIVLFAVVESLFSELLEARLGLPNMFGAAFSGATVALIVIPLRGRLSRWAVRWMPEPEKATGENQAPSSA